MPNQMLERGGAEEHCKKDACVNFRLRRNPSLASRVVLCSRFWIPEHLVRLPELLKQLRRGRVVRMLVRVRLLCHLVVLSLYLVRRRRGFHPENLIVRRVDDRIITAAAAAALLGIRRGRARASSAAAPARKATESAGVVQARADHRLAQPRSLEDVVVVGGDCERFAIEILLHPLTDRVVPALAVRLLHQAHRRVHDTAAHLERPHAYCDQRHCPRREERSSQSAHKASKSAVNSADRGQDRHGRHPHRHAFHNRLEARNEAGATVPRSPRAEEIRKLHLANDAEVHLLVRGGRGRDGDHVHDWRT
mmetsp:Transcript_23270/g.75777  ORF Transcript_23270/g.75777 Transcript_23270/m.75777 type:complete len:307 (+) Transcript_23270:871-1791(+)